MFASGTLAADVFHSLNRVIVGILIGATVGLATAVLMALSRTVEEYSAFLLELIRPIPPIAWVPIAILWFGIGDAPAYFLVSLGAFFPVFTNTLKGIKSIERKYLDLAMSLGASRSLALRKVGIPLILPDVMAGLKIGMGVGWIVVITAEMVGAQNGLGYMIQLNRTLLQMPNVIVGMIVIGIVGLFLVSLLTVAERVVMPWKNRMATLGRQL